MVQHIMEEEEDNNNNNNNNKKKKKKKGPKTWNKLTQRFLSLVVILMILLGIPFLFQTHLLTRYTTTREKKKSISTTTGSISVESSLQSEKSQQQQQQQPPMSVGVPSSLIESELESLREDGLRIFVYPDPTDDMIRFMNSPNFNLLQDDVYNNNNNNNNNNTTHRNSSNSTNNNINNYYYYTRKTRTRKRKRRIYHRNYFQLEYKLLEGLRQRNRIVTNPNDATHFWVQHSLILHWIEDPPNGQRRGTQKTRFNGLNHYYYQHLQPLLQHIYYEYPYFNRSNGRDHIFVYVMDHGPICEIGYSSNLFINDVIFQKTVWNMKLIGYYGQRNSQRTTKLSSLSSSSSQHHHQSTTTTVEDVIKEEDPSPQQQQQQQQQQMQQQQRSKTCWDETKDIVVPQWHDWDMTSSPTTGLPNPSSSSTTNAQQSQITGSSSLEEAVLKCFGGGGGAAAPVTNNKNPPFRHDENNNKNKNDDYCAIWYNYLHFRATKATRPFFFKGNIHLAGHSCSKGIRPWLTQYCTKLKPESCYWISGSSSSSSSSSDKNQEHITRTMDEAVFALSPAGWACWSSRLYDALYQIVVPIILADDMVLPFEQYLSKYYNEMVIRIPTGNPTNWSFHNHPSSSSSSGTNNTTTTTTTDNDTDGVGALQVLVDRANDWIQTCRNITLYQDCLDHSVSTKMAAIVRHRKWLGWQNHPQRSSENAFAMVEMELMSPPKNISSSSTST